MVNPGVFQGMRKEFLLGEKPSYALAVDGGYAADGLADIIRRFLKRFPLDLADNQEPSAEHLAAVDDGTADAEVEEPDPTKMSPEEFEAAKARMKARQERFVFKQAQIKRWMAYQYRKDHDLDATESGMFNQYRALMAKLTQKSIDQPCLKTPVNVWRKTQRDVIEAECRKIVEETKDKPLAPGEKKECLIAMRSRVATRLFGKLSEEDRVFWEMEATAEHEVALAQWKAEMKAPVSTDPAARQRSIQGLIQFVQPILDRISEVTGWKVSLITGGPEPAHGGQLNVISIHSGTTSGDVKMNFGRSERARFRSTVVPLYGAFLRKCYTPEECRARALPKEEGYIPIAELELDNELASCDTIAWEGPLVAPTAVGSTPGASVSSSQTVANPSNVLKETKSKANTKAPPPQQTPRLAKKPRSTPAPSEAVVAPPTPSQNVQPTPAPSEAVVAPPTPSQNVQPTTAAGDDVAMASDDNPFPFEVPATPRPSSPPPSLPPSPIHSLRGSRVGSPVCPPQSVNAPGPGPMDIKEDAGAQAEPISEGGSPKGGARRSARMAKGSASRSEDENGGRRRGRKRGAAEEATLAMGAVSNAGRMKKRRTSAVAPSNESLIVDPPSDTTATQPLVVDPSANTTASATQPLVVNPSANTPAWFTNAMSMLVSRELGKEWRALLDHWAAFEASQSYTGSGYLSAANRPTAVKDWIQRARSSTWHAPISNTEQYGVQFMRWWMNLQLDWRRADDGALRAPDGQEGGWEGVGKGGVNGLLSVVVALFFWGFVVAQNGTQDDRWLAAVKEVDAVLLYLVSL